MKCTMLPQGHNNGIIRLGNPLQLRTILWGVEIGFAGNEIEYRGQAEVGERQGDDHDKEATESSLSGCLGLLHVVGAEESSTR